MPGLQADHVRVKVWDWPTRISHWLLVVLMVLCWWWGDVKVDLPLHKLAGLTVLGLLVFRLYWGFFGSASARFGNFVKSPKEALAYGKKLVSEPAEIHAGHTPLGGYSVVAMLVLLVAQVGLGLFSIDTDDMDPGPLAFMIDGDTGLFLAKLHSINFWIVVGLIALHILAVAYYVFIKRNDIVSAMIGGWKAFPKATAPSVPFASPVRLVVGLVLAGGVAYAFANAEALLHMLKKL